MIGIIRNLFIWLHLIDRPNLIGRSIVQHPSPEELVTGVLLIVEDGVVRKWVCFRCPCGCGEKIMLSLAPQRHPHWTVGMDWLRRPTLSPSVRQVTQCRSHYWVRRGRVQWCPDSGPRGGSLDTNVESGRGS